MAVWLLTPRLTWACPICLADPNSPMAVGASWGMLVLLGITAGMFSAFAGFFLYLMKRARMAIRDVAASNGLGVVCVRVPEGERFTFIITDSTKVRELGFQTIERLMRESELRAQLALAGFPQPAVEESIQVARHLGHGNRATSSRRLSAREWAGLAGWSPGLASVGQSRSRPIGPPFQRQRLDRTVGCRAPA